MTIDISIYSDYPIDRPPEETTGHLLPVPMKTPWLLNESMTGTTWRNVHTGSEFVVDTVGKDVYGRLDMLEKKPVFGDVRDHLGMWRDGTFRVEHWIRVDHQSHGMQLDWMLYEASFWRSEADRYHRDAVRALKEQRISCWKENAIFWEEHADRYNRQAIQLLDQCRNFAEIHGLAISTDDLNKTAIGQLVLF